MGCSVCNRTACKDHFAFCHLSGMPMCPAHTQHCHNCGKPTHPGKLHPVGESKASYCEACAVTCSEPHPVQVWFPRRGAVRCAGQHSHNHFLCLEHAHTCARHPPGAVFCGGHLEACSSCGDKACPDHRISSAISGKVFCSDHLFNCPRCKSQVGINEKVLARDGQAVCQNCAQHCPDCAPGQTPWVLDQLQPCPHCLKDGIASGRVAAQASVDLLKRLYPQVARCPEHRTPCHLCGRTGCSRHVQPCPECQQPTCPDDLVTTAEGSRVCRACVHTCKTCPDTHLHLKRSLQACAVCGEHCCFDHRTLCQSCLGAACADHTHTCKLCQQPMCGNCHQDGLCTACKGLKPTDSLPASFPLSSAAQKGVCFKATHARGDGSRRIHVVYYGEFKGFAEIALSLLRQPVARLDVLEATQGQVKRIHTRILTKKENPLPSFDLWKYFRSKG